MTIFFVAPLPQFVERGERNPRVRLVVLRAVSMVVTSVVVAAHGEFAAAGRDHVASRPPIMTWRRPSSAASLVGLSTTLATTTR